MSSNKFYIILKFIKMSRDSKIIIAIIIIIIIIKKDCKKSLWKITKSF